MLGQLRRHANSWVIKTALAMIVLSFMLFFGYSRIASRYHDEHINAAIVGHTEIPRRKFENYYQTSLERLRESMKGELPEGMGNFFKDQVLKQMISREVLVQ